MITKEQIEVILKRVADRDGVSVEYVRSEIQKAILIGLSNPDPNVRTFWMSIPHTGPRPTPEDVLIYLSTHIDRHPL